MNYISLLCRIIIVCYIIVSSCGVLSLVVDIYARKRNMQGTPAYRDWAYRIFNLLHLPLALVCIAMSIISQIESGGDNTDLILSTLFIIISLSSEIIRGFYFITNTGSGENIAGSEYNHVYRAASNYYNAKTERVNVCRQTIEKFDLFVDEIGRNIVAINSAYTSIHDYMQIQKDECVSLREGRDSYLAIYRALEENTKKCNDYFIEFIDKIQSSSASIKYCVEGEALLNDIGSSFKDNFKYHSEFINKDIYTVIERINEVCDKCSQFNMMFKLYDDIIQSYSRRLEASLNNNKPVVFRSEDGVAITLSDFINNIIDVKGLDNTTAESAVQHDTETAGQIDDKLLAKKNKEIVKYKNEINDLTVMYNEKTEKLAKTAKKRKRALVTVIVLGLLLFIVTASIMAGSKNSWMNDYFSLLDKYMVLNEEKLNIQSQYEEFGKIARQVITISNLNIEYWQNGRWNKAPSNGITATPVRFIRPQIEYSSLINEEVTLYIKVVHPNGYVLRTSLPSEIYTYSGVFTISRGRYTYNLGSLGDDNYIFDRGEYTIEIYYNDVVLISRKVTLL